VHTDVRVSPRDLYALRKAHLLAERKDLVSRMAYCTLKRLTLEIERKYALLTRNARLDINSGAILNDDRAEGSGEER